MTSTIIAMDDDVGLRTWTSGSADAGRPAVVMLHGGPGVPDYLGPVGALIEDLCLVHRYDQRGVGGSRWDGEHTIARHVEDLMRLLDAWSHQRVILVGHSFGTNIADYVLLAHPERVERLVHLAGPFLDPWRDAYREASRARRTPAQQERLDELDAIPSRDEGDEIEYLTLSWLTDHADREHALRWAHDSALAQRPINYEVNTQLGVAKRIDPLESHLPALARLTPPGSVIIGGEGDPRPAAALRRHAAEVGCDVVIIPDAGHHPWLDTPDLFAGALRAAITGADVF